MTFSVRDVLTHKRTKPYANRMWQTVPCANTHIFDGPNYVIVRVAALTAKTRYRHLSVINLATGMQWKCRIRTNGIDTVLCMLSLSSIFGIEFSPPSLFFFLSSNESLCVHLISRCSLLILLRGERTTELRCCYLVIFFSCLSRSIIFCIALFAGFLMVLVVGRLLRSPWKLLSHPHFSSDLCIWRHILFTFFFAISLSFKIHTHMYKTKGRYFKW